MKVPAFLKKKDKIGIVAPAGNIPHSIDAAVALLESWGLEVVVGESVSSYFHQFAGDDSVRTRDLQRMLDDDSIRAVIAARGGYGTVRIIDELDFSRFAENPKWLIGFSDITVLHSHIQALFQTASIHGQMPLTIPDATKPSLDSLRKALFGEDLSHQYVSTSHTIPGRASGILTGGNLAILQSISGSVSEVDFRGKVLFIEDVGEYYYAVDRMMRMLKRAGKLKDLSALLVGSFSDMKDRHPGFGSTPEEIILDVVSEYGYPVATDYPAGHVDNNYALVLGKEVTLDVDGKHIRLKYTH